MKRIVDIRPVLCLRIDEDIGAYGPHRSRNVFREFPAVRLRGSHVTLDDLHAAGRDAVLECGCGNIAAH